MLINIPVIRWLRRDGYVRTVKCDGYMLQIVFDGTLVPIESSSAFLERFVFVELRIWTGDKVATCVFTVMIAKYGN